MSVPVTVHHVPGAMEFVQIQMEALTVFVWMGGCLVKITTVVLVSFLNKKVLLSIIFAVRGVILFLVFFS